MKELEAKNFSVRRLKDWADGLAEGETCKSLGEHLQWYARSWDKDLRDAKSALFELDHPSMDGSHILRAKTILKRLERRKDS